MENREYKDIHYGILYSLDRDGILESESDCTTTAGAAAQLLTKLTMALIPLPPETDGCNNNNG